MKNIKKTAIAMTLGILAFGFSAFKTKEKSSVYVYYKVDMTYPLANNANGYAYYGSDHCETGGNLCTAQWDIGSNPAPVTDGTPLPTTGVTFITNSVVNGHFE